MKRVVYEGYRKDNIRNDSVGEGKMKNRKEELEGRRWMIVIVVVVVVIDGESRGRDDG